MSFDLFNASIAEPLLLSSSEQSVDEVGSIRRPTIRYIPPLKLYLFGHHVLANLPTVSPPVRTLDNIKKYPAEHALIDYDSHSKVVHRKRVILSVDNFRSHVSRRSAGILEVIWLD